MNMRWHFITRGFVEKVKYAQAEKNFHNCDDRQYYENRYTQKFGSWKSGFLTNGGQVFTVNRQVHSEDLTPLIQSKKPP
jgi:hypothetical protein